jgi:hypothetical protein
MTLEAFKVATQLQWTGPIIDIKEHCFGVVHPITKQTNTQYRKLQHDPHLKDLWVPAFSKEVRCLTRGKPGVTKATNTTFFLSHNEIQHIPSNRTVTYAQIVINHCLQKENPNHVRITVGGLINYPFELTTCTTDMVSSKLLWNSTISTKGAHFAGTDIKIMYPETPLATAPVPTGYHQPLQSQQQGIKWLCLHGNLQGNVQSPTGRHSGQQSSQETRHYSWLL